MTEVRASRVVDLAGRWKHGWIPLDAAALASKYHGKPPAGGGKYGKGIKSGGKIRQTGRARQLQDREFQLRNISQPTRAEKANLKRTLAEMREAGVPRARRRHDTEAQERFLGQQGLTRRQHRKLSSREKIERGTVGPKTTPKKRVASGASSGVPSHDEYVRKHYSDEQLQAAEKTNRIGEGGEGFSKADARRLRFYRAELKRRGVRPLREDELNVYQKRKPTRGIAPGEPTSSKTRKSPESKVDAEKSYSKGDKVQVVRNGVVQQNGEIVGFDRHGAARVRNSKDGTVTSYYARDLRKPGGSKRRSK